MSALLGQIGSLLTTPPGNLIYWLVLAFSIAGALQAVFLQWRSSGAVPDWRAIRGLGAMLASLLVFFVLGIVVAGAIPAAQAFLPPLDRAISLILLTWVIWIWAFPEPSKQPDLAAVVLTAMAALAGVLSAIPETMRPADAGFNQGVANILWQLSTLGLLALGGALLYIRRTEGFVNALAFLGLAFLGHAIHLIFREPGDYSGIVRLAHIAAFPLLLTLSQRFGIPAAQASAPPSGKQPRTEEARRYGADAKTVHALLALTAEADALRASQAMARAVSHTMLADLCFIMLLTMTGTA